MIKKQKNNKGITLIALAVTLILIILLSAITINYIFGEDGVISMAKRADFEQKIALVTEYLELAQVDVAAVNGGKITLETYIQYLIDEEIIDEADVEFETAKTLQTIRLASQTEPVIPGSITSCLITIDEGFVYEISEPSSGNGVIIKYLGQLTNLPPRIKSIMATNTTSTTTVEIITKGTEVEKYVYYIKKESETEYGEGIEKEENTHTFEKLEQLTLYTVKIEAIGSNGTIAEAVLRNILTGELPKGAIEFTNLNWTNEGAEITLTTEEDYKIQYQILDLEGKWSDWSEPVKSSVTVTGLLHGEQIYARLFDGTNYGQHASFNILDIIGPKINSVTGNPDEWQTGTATLIVNATDDQSGLASKPYKFR